MAALAWPCVVMMSAAVVCMSYVAGAGAAVAMPTPAQLRMMDRGLAQFMHFSVDPFTSIEHNCVGTSPDCIPASVFNPTNLSTDQVRACSPCLPACFAAALCHVQGCACHIHASFFHCAPT